MRGTYTATYLDQVANTFARQRGTGRLDIGVAFDLITGTSTGGIIACALAKGIAMSEVVDLYCKDGPKIFARRMPTLRNLLPDLFRRSKALSEGNEVLRAALVARLGDTKVRDILDDRGIALAIPAVEMGQHRSWVFKTAHVPRSNKRDDNYTLVDVCLATSAAPVYRSMAAIDDPDSTNGRGYNIFVDGGLWANNPILVGLIDALDMAAPDQDIQIFSLGTCPVPAGEQLPRGAVNRGLLEWKMGANAASLSIDAQQFAFDNMAKKLISHLGNGRRQCTVVRFPADKVPGAVIPYLELDDTREEAFEALINQARSDANMTNSRCMAAARDPEAQLICDLFESMPVISDPLYRRKSAISPIPLEGASHV